MPVFEVELKARVADPGAALERIAAFAEYRRDFNKSDAYWHGPGWRDARGSKGFRLRVDGAASMVTFKDKTYEAGVEVNAETEFEVGDAEAFRALVTRIGCEPYYEKSKSGKAFSYGGCTIELCSVSGLGWFVEIERLVETGSEAELAEARATVRRVLSLCGVPESSIEPKTYSELILGGAGSPTRA